MKNARNPRHTSRANFDVRMKKEKIHDMSELIGRNHASHACQNEKKWNRNKTPVVKNDDNDKIFNETWLGQSQTHNSHVFGRY